LSVLLRQAGGFERFTFEPKVRAVSLRNAARAALAAVAAIAEEQVGPDTERNQEDLGRHTPTL
jgi:hypothetical protein